MNLSRFIEQRENFDYLFWSSATPLVIRGIIPIPSPFSLTFVITKRCNSRCTMCNIWNSDEHEELSLEDVQRIFAENDFSSLTSLTLTGGEPVLRNDLPELLKCITDACPHLRQVTLATSGLNTNRTIDLVKACLKEISVRRTIKRFTVQVSIDGVGELHDRIRGIPGYFKRAMETLRHLEDLAMENGNLFLKLSSTVQPANIDSVANTRKFAKRHGIPIRFGALVYSSSYYKNTNILNDLYFTPKQAKQAAVFFSKMANEEAGSNVKFYYRDVAKMVLGEQRSRACMMGYYGFVLENDGTVYPCVNCETKAFGNLLKHNFKEIWWGLRAGQLRQDIRANCCPTCASICYTLPGNLGEVINVSLNRII